MLRGEDSRGRAAAKRATAPRRAAVAVGLLASLGAACTSQLSSTAPSPLQSGAASPPAPTDGRFMLRGRVSESPPTATTGIALAVVTIREGVNAGRSAAADGGGFYVLHDLSPGAFTAEAEAGWFVSSRMPLVLGAADAVQHFQLRPVPATVEYALNGDIAGGDGTCSDGESLKPCRIVVIPIHNEGLVDATLTWQSSQSADLDLALFKTGVAQPIVRSSSSGNSGSSGERVVARIDGSATYEFRITWAAGTGRATYRLQALCPN